MLFFLLKNPEENFNVFSLGNNYEYFLNSISLLEWFLKDHDTEAWNNDARNKLHM